MTTRSKGRDGATSTEGDDQASESAVSVASLIQGLAKQLADQAAATTTQLEAQTAAITKEIDQRLTDQAAALQDQLLRQSAESARVLEERIKSQLDAESDRLRETVRKELEGVREVTDKLQQGHEQHEQRLQEQSQELERQKGRQDTVEGEIKVLQAEVRSFHDSVQAQVTAVQRELYSRISDVSSRPATPVGSDVVVRTLSNAGSGKFKAHPNVYNGSIPWQQYVTQYELIASLNGWADVEKAKLLCASLQGPALAVLCALPAAERENYALLTAALNERFGARRTAESARVELESRKKNGNESWLQFACDLGALVEAAHPNITTDTRDVLTKDKFIQSLPSELRRQVKLARPVSLSETIACTTEIHSILVAEDNQRLVDRPFNRHVRQVECGEEVESWGEGDRYPRQQRGGYRRDNEWKGEGPVRERRTSESDHVTTQSRGNRPSNRGAGTENGHEKCQQEIAELRDEIDRRFNGRNNRQRRNSDQTDRRNGTCFFCHSEGHYARACPAKARRTDETERKNFQ